MEMKEFTAIGGKKRIFEFRQFSILTGFKYEAVEIQDGEPKGVVFSVLSDEVDTDYWKNKLEGKIKKALAVRHIKYDERTNTWSTCNSIVRGQIKWDSKSEEPLIVIDGNELSWEAFARTMLVYEGFQFMLRFADPVEDVFGLNIMGE